MKFLYLIHIHAVGRYSNLGIGLRIPHTSVQDLQQDLVLKPYLVIKKIREGKYISILKDRTHYFGIVSHSMNILPTARRKVIIYNLKFLPFRLCHF